MHLFAVFVQDEMELTDFNSADCFTTLFYTEKKIVESFLEIKKINVYLLSEQGVSTKLSTATVKAHTADK